MQEARIFLIALPGVLLALWALYGVWRQGGELLAAERGPAVTSTATRLLAAAAWLAAGRHARAAGDALRRALQLRQRQRRHERRRRQPGELPAALLAVDRSRRPDRLRDQEELEPARARRDRRRPRRSPPRSAATRTRARRRIARVFTLQALTPLPAGASPLTVTASLAADPITGKQPITAVGFSNTDGSGSGPTATLDRRREAPGQRHDQDPAEQRLPGQQHPAHRDGDPADHLPGLHAAASSATTCPSASGTATGPGRDALARDRGRHPAGPRRRARRNGRARARAARRARSHGRAGGGHPLGLRRRARDHHGERPAPRPVGRRQRGARQRRRVARAPHAAAHPHGRHARPLRRAALRRAAAARGGGRRRLLDRPAEPAPTRSTSASWSPARAAATGSPSRCPTTGRPGATTRSRARR